MLVAKVCALGVILAAPAPVASLVGSGRSTSSGQSGASEATEAPMWVTKRGKKKKRDDPPPAPDPAPGPATPGDAGAEAEAPALPARLPDPPQLSKKYRGVALLPLEGFEVDQGLLGSIEAALLSEIDETKGLRSVTPADVLNDLQKHDIRVDRCEGALECLAASGRYARAHLAIHARVAALGGTISISMRLIDTVKKTEVGRVADPVSEDRKERAQELHRLAVQLLNPKTYVGSLKIKTSVAGADVYLDDKLVGTTPMKKPLAGLRAGPHILRVTKPGFADLNRFVDVIYKRSSTIDIDLNTNTIGGVIIEEVSNTGFGLLYVATDQAGIEIRVDGEPKDTTILDAPIQKIAAGVRRISFWRDGESTQVDEVSIEPGRRTDIRLAVGPDGGMAAELMAVVNASDPLPAAATIAAIEPSPRTTIVDAETKGFTWKIWAGLGLAIGGAGAIAVAAIFGARVQSKAEERDDFLGTASGGVTAQDYLQLQADLDKINDEGQAAAINQFIFYGVGGALMATAAIFIILDLLGSSEPAAVDASTDTAVGLTPLDGGGMLLFERRF